MPACAGDSGGEKNGGRRQQSQQDSLMCLVSLDSLSVSDRDTVLHRKASRAPEKFPAAKNRLRLLQIVLQTRGIMVLYRGQLAQW